MIEHIPDGEVQLFGNFSLRSRPRASTPMTRNRSTDVIAFTKSSISGFVSIFRIRKSNLILVELDFNGILP